MTINQMIEWLKKEKDAGWYGDFGNNLGAVAATLRQLQNDSDRALRVLKEVDGILLDYIERLEKKPEAAILAHGRSVALAVKYMVAVLEELK